jgi:hypothetical protein
MVALLVCLAAVCQTFCLHARKLSVLHALCIGGNLRLVAGMARDLPVFYNSVVDQIWYSAEGVAVSAGDRVFKGLPPLPPLFPRRGQHSFQCMEWAFIPVQSCSFQELVVSVLQTYCVIAQETRC